MKHLIYKSVIAFVLLFGLQGCYTKLWSPDMEFPNASNSSQVYNYYYHGHYYDYYYSPWWYNITPPAVYNDPGSTRDSETGAIRNNDGGRSGQGTVLTPGTPGRNSGGSASPPPAKSSDSGKDNSRSGSSSGSSDIRNNDGGRNTDKGKR
jgi:hypothetical protein